MKEIFSGRLLAYVLVGGQDFNAVLVEQGYARVRMEGDSSQEQEYLQLQEQAQARGIGLWQCAESTTIPTHTPTPLYPATPTLTSTDVRVVIDCILYDGLIARTEADEYVQITNYGQESQDLLGWLLIDVDKGYPQFIFPSFLLESGETVRVYTNEMHQEWGGFSFGYSRAVWNNSQPDTAALYSAVGILISVASYPLGC